jgi:hypothetical protein
MTRNLRMGITRPTQPTLAEIEQQWEDLLTEADLPSQHATSPADRDPASPPITALSTPEPLPPPPGPSQHTLKSVFEQFALYGLAGEAVRTLAPQTEAQPEAGLHSAAPGRAEAQVLRISAIYAALDCSSIIRLLHLQAALAMWDYCSYSAASLFGACVGDSVAIASSRLFRPPKTASPENKFAASSMAMSVAARSTGPSKNSALSE